MIIDDGVDEVKAPHRVTGKTLVEVEDHIGSGSSEKERKKNKRGGLDGLFFFYLSSKYTTIDTHLQSIPWHFPIEDRRSWPTLTGSTSVFFDDIAILIGTVTLALPYF